MRPSSYPWPLRIAGVALALGLLCATFRTVDTAEVVRILVRTGPRLSFLLVPSMAAIGLEAFAWQRALRVLGVRAALLSVARVRVASESIGSLLPFGAVFADAVKPPLLARHCGAPLAVGVVAIAARKYLLVLAQGVYLLVGFAVGHAALSDGFVHAGAPGSLALLAALAGVILIFVSEGIAASFRGGTAFRSLFRVLSKIPSGTLRRRLAALENDAVRTDGVAACFFSAPLGARLIRAAPCLGTWLCEAVETWLILRAIGADVPLGAAVGIEALVVLSRHLLVVLPGGLGVQELGYATLLAGAGVDIGTCAAFTLCKRLRELAWVTIGAVLLVWAPSHTVRPTPSAAVPR